LRGVLSVSELTHRVAQAIEADPELTECTVRGEISNFKRHTSGHLYFSLKDEGATVPCVMWRGAAGSLNFAPADGQDVLATGRVGVYAPHGKYQFYADNLVPVGRGDLWARFEELKRRLAAEGLFDEARKRALPRHPRAIGIVSSPTGAAVQDMLKIIGRRYPAAEIVLAPAVVQGESAPSSLVAALRRVASAGVDVVIIGRGGGSMEDLWCFNDERVVRAIVACPVPVISAVGHETDVTLADFAADVRAPTPSAAAELAVPDAREIAAWLDGITRRLQNALRTRVERERSAMASLGRRLPFARPGDLLAARLQALDDATERLAAAAGRRIADRAVALSVLGGRLGALGPRSTLARGYAIARRSDRRLVRSVADVSVGDGVEIVVADGSIGAEVRTTRADAAGE
jgi:exodeoxyribonuclease VII large subunit